MSEYAELIGGSRMKKNLEHHGQIKRLAEVLDGLDETRRAIIVDSITTIVKTLKAGRPEIVAVNASHINHDDRWITQSEAFRIMGYAHRGRISHLIQDGRLSTNGKQGRACRVLFSSVLLVLNNQRRNVECPNCGTEYKRLRTGEVI